MRLVIFIAVLVLLGWRGNAQGVKGEKLKLPPDSLAGETVAFKELSLGIGVGSFIKIPIVNVTDDFNWAYLYDFNVRQMFTHRCALHLEYFRAKRGNDRDQPWFGKDRHIVNAIKFKALFNNKKITMNGSFMEFGLTAFYNHSSRVKNFKAQDLLGGAYEWKTKKINHTSGVGVNLSQNTRLGKLLIKIELEVGKAFFDKKVRPQGLLWDPLFMPGIGLVERAYFNIDLEVYIPLYTFNKSK